MKTAIYLIIIALSISSFLPISKAQNEEGLYVNSYSNTLAEWNNVGNSPFLHVDPSSFIYINVEDAKDAWFGFQNSTLNGTIGQVVLRLSAKIELGGDDLFEVYLQALNLNETKVGVILPANASYTYYDIDVTTYLNEWSKIDTAKLKVIYRQIGGDATLIYINRAYIKVTLKTEKLPGAGPAPFYMLTVKVFHWRGYPLQNVNVTAFQYSTNQTYWSLTDGNGTATFELPTGYYEVKAHVDTETLSTGWIYHNKEENIQLTRTILHDIAGWTKRNWLFTAILLILGLALIYTAKAKTEKPSYIPQLR